MSRCSPEVPASGSGEDYPLLASVPGHAPDRRLTGPRWFARPGLELPPAPLPVTDPFDLDDPHGGWYPA